MNLSALTAKEVMRICHPETELEKRLFDIVNEVQSEIDDAIDERDQAIQELNFDNYGDEFFTPKSEVELALNEISSGQIEKAKDRLEKSI